MHYLLAGRTLHSASRRASAFVCSVNSNKGAAVGPSRRDMLSTATIVGEMSGFPCGPCASQACACSDTSLIFFRCTSFGVGRRCLAVLIMSGDKFVGASMVGRVYASAAAGDFTTAPNGLQFRDDVVGTGPSPVKGAKIR